MMISPNGNGLPRFAAIAALAVAACLAVAQRPDFGPSSARSTAAAGPAAPAPIDNRPLALRLAWQIALDREGFSPGVIDGRIGSKTQLATREFQRARGLSVTGELDAATLEALNVRPERATFAYTIQASDFSQIGENPSDWNAKSRMSFLGYESLAAALAEKFHCSQALLAELNGGRDVNAMGAGDRLVAPAVGAAAGVDAPIVAGDRIVIHLGEKVIRLYSGETLVGLFHCSIAAKQSKRPSGSARVTVISENPTYAFDPAMWPEVHNVSRKLIIPPGPRNPVGLCWVGLSLPGYGMHGTPNPELIGKTGSHGCFRLANWDALRLGKMVQVGTPVKFLD